METYCDKLLKFLTLFMKLCLVQYSIYHNVLHIQYQIVVHQQLIQLWCNCSNFLVVHIETKMVVITTVALYI